MATKPTTKKNPGAVQDLTMLLVAAAAGLYLWNAYKAKQLPGQ